MRDLHASGGDCPQAEELLNFRQAKGSVPDGHLVYPALEVSVRVRRTQPNSELLIIAVSFIPVCTSIRMKHPFFAMPGGWVMDISCITCIGY